MYKKGFMETTSVYNLPEETLVTHNNIKYYRVINSDLFINNKLIPEGSIIDFFEPSLANFLIPAKESEIISSVYSANPNLKRGRGRPRKI